MPELTRVQTLELAFIDSGAAAQQPFTTFDVSGNTESYQEAAAHRAAEKQAFLSETTGNPVFNNCPGFTEDNQQRRGIFKTVEGIGRRVVLHSERGDECNPGLAVLHDLVAMRRSEYTAVQNAAVIAKRDNVSAPIVSGRSAWGDIRTPLAQTVKQELRTAYGMPDRHRTAHLIAQRRADAERVYETPDHPLRAVASEILERTNAVDIEYIPPKDLDTEQISYYAGLLDDMVQPGLTHAFKTYGEQDTFTPVEMLDITRRYMDHEGYAEAGFGAELVAGRSTSLANMAQKAVLIGEKRSKAQLAKKPIENTIIHEVRGHIGRMIAGRAIGSGLAGYALDRANDFEEPWITTLINMRSGKAPLLGDPSILSIGLAAGYDGSSERDLRDSFELHWRMALLKSYDDQKPLDGQIATTRKAALDRQERIWRGMPTDIPGCIMPRDHAYDNSRVLAYLQPEGGVLDRDEFMKLFTARYDPTRRTHQRYIDMALVS